MKSLLDYLRTSVLVPTLVRRSVFTVSFTFFLVWLVLLAYQYNRERPLVPTDTGLQKYGNAMMIALQDIEEVQEAVTFVEATEKWTTIRRREIGVLPGIVKYELMDAQGKRIYASVGLRDVVLTSVVGRLLGQEIAGQDHRVYQGQTTPPSVGQPSRWTMRIAEPWRSTSDILFFSSKLVLPYLLLAVPFVLLPLWLSVRHGLKPLKRLAEAHKQRRAGDLSPIGFRAKHQELKPLEASLDELLCQLRKKLARERAFVQDAAHELRTPLAVISAQAYVMARAGNPVDRSLAHGHLDNAIARASHLSQQLLALAALDDAQPIHPTPIDLSQWLRQTIAQLAPTAMVRQIDISLEAPDFLRREVDEGALTSIVHNLLDNAIKYGRTGGGIVVTLVAECAGFQLTVQDDGPGIALSDEVHIFERFYRGTGHESSGSGLGLAIVRQAAMRLGGRVTMVAGLAGTGVGFRVAVIAG